MKKYIWNMSMNIKENKQTVRKIIRKYRIPYVECRTLKHVVRNLHEGKLPCLFLSDKAERTESVIPVLSISDTHGKRLLTAFCRMMQHERSIHK